MLGVKIITVGKLKEKYLRDACAEYAKRLNRFCSLEIIELEEYRISDNPSEKEINKALDEEGKNIINRCRGMIVTMCIEGKQLSSVELSEKIADAGIVGQGYITFVIGSSYGISDEVKRLSNLKLSMSKMTFPHQLARVMLLEQIYRGFQICSNGKYHK